MSTTVDQHFARLRARFPQLESAIHLAVCSHAPVCREVLTALKRYERSLVQEGVAWDTWMEEVDLARAAFASLIGAQAQNIAVLPGVSEALCSLSSCLPWEGRDQVIVISQSCPAMSQVFLAAQAQWRSTVCFVDSAEGPASAQMLEPLLNAHTALLCVSLVSQHTAARQPLAEIAELAHQYGALVLVDASHVVGAFPFTAAAYGIDLVVCGAHTYLLGLPGLAFVYVRPGLSLTPLVTGWLGRRDPCAPSASELSYAPGGSGLERGMPPILQAYAAHAGIRCVQQVGVPAIAKHLSTLTEVAIQGAQARGLEVASPRDPGQHGPFVAVRVGPKARHIAAHLARLRVVVAPCHDLIRLAPTFATSAQDLDVAIEILAEVRERDLPALRPPAWLARRQVDAGAEEPRTRRNRRK